jgi:hypothetical protein
MSANLDDPQNSNSLPADPEADQRALTEVQQY